MSPVQIWVLAPFLSAIRAPNGSGIGTVRCFFCTEDLPSGATADLGTQNSPTEHKKRDGSRTTPSLAYWCFPVSCSAPLFCTSTGLCIDVIHNVVKGTILRNGSSGHKRLLGVTCRETRGLVVSQMTHRPIPADARIVRSKRTIGTSFELRCWCGSQPKRCERGSERDPTHQNKQPRPLGLPLTAKP